MSHTAELRLGCAGAQREHPDAGAAALPLLHPAGRGDAPAPAGDLTDLFRRLEACGQLIRLDPGVEPARFRCATVSQGELTSLRSIENVIRLGRVTRIGPDQIKLAGGSIPADRGQVHVDCSAAGLRTKPARPVYSHGLITLQQIRACQPVFSAALADHQGNPLMESALARLFTNIEPAISKLETLMAGTGGGSVVR
jgi:hypothetical protein